MNNLDAEEGLGIYQKRMKVEEAFKDLKSLLCLDKLMNKRQGYMEKMVAMVLIAYSIGLLVGKTIRDWICCNEENAYKTKKKEAA
jgi:IS4 transposase